MSNIDMLKNVCEEHRTDTGYSRYQARVNILTSLPLMSQLEIALEESSLFNDLLDIRNLINELYYMPQNDIVGYIKTKLLMKEGETLEDIIQDLESTLCISIPPITEEDVKNIYIKSDKYLNQGKLL